MNRRGRLGSLLPQRPASAWALALLLLGAGARCLAGTGSHIPAGPTATLATAVGAMCLALAGAVYLIPRRPPHSVALVLLGLTTGVTSLLVASSLDRAGVALSALAYPWTALYAALFLNRREAYANVGLTGIGFALGIIASGRPGLIGAWILVTITVLGVTITTSGLVAAMRRLSETDPLTRVVNRAGFRRQAHQVFASAARRGQPVALVLCDIDGLKQVNDAKGHAAGDALITDVVNGWRGVLRGEDVLARIGGDEFAVLLPDTSPSGALAAVERLRKGTDNAFSAGVASWTPGMSLDALLAGADAEMYACKSRRSAVSANLPAPRRPGMAVPSMRPTPTLAE